MARTLGQQFRVATRIEGAHGANLALPHPGSKHPDILEQIDGLLNEKAKTLVTEMEERIRQGKELQEEMDALGHSSPLFASLLDQKDHAGVIHIDLGADVREEAVERLESYKRLASICRSNDVNMSIAHNGHRTAITIDMKAPFVDKNAPPKPPEKRRKQTQPAA